MQRPISPAWALTIIALVGICAIFFAPYAHSLNLIHQKDATLTIVMGSNMIICSLLVMLKKHHEKNPLPQERTSSVDQPHPPPSTPQILPVSSTMALPIPRYQRSFIQTGPCEHSSDIKTTFVKEEQIPLAYVHKLSKDMPQCLLRMQNMLFGIHSPKKNSVNLEELLERVLKEAETELHFKTLCANYLPVDLQITLICLKGKNTYWTFNKEYETRILSIGQKEYAVLGSKDFWTHIRLDSVNSYLESANILSSKAEALLFDINFDPKHELLLTLIPLY